MDLRVAAANSATCVVDAARIAMLHHSSTLPISASGALGPYDVG